MAAIVSASSKWGLIRPFFLILLLHSLAIYIFTRGFLLTRTELSSFSNCSDISQSPCSSPEPPPPDSRPHDGCWTKPAVDRLVIIVLDALRFDFVAPSTFFEEAKPWMDKLPVLHRLASANQSSARIFKAIADPPTTSLQRLKALTTGGLPTFIDVGNSFGAPAIVEDNLLYQLGRNGKRVLMMGDDTWLQLFPDHFEKSFPYPSFNVKDLHTVDDGVIEHLVPSLQRQDWDVLIAHFLGMDHAGHIYGVDSTPMIKKLEQYNDILEAVSIVSVEDRHEVCTSFLWIAVESSIWVVSTDDSTTWDKMPSFLYNLRNHSLGRGLEVVEVLKCHSEPGGLHENTLLVVMGDHGQTTNGDHGGGTAEEVETSLFAMSLRSPPDSVSSILDKRFCKPDLDGEMMCVSSIQQLDFAVTVAALLGIPFPFGRPMMKAVILRLSSQDPVIFRFYINNSVCIQRIRNSMCRGLSDDEAESLFSPPFSSFFLLLLGKSVIGRINPELYALSGGTWDMQSTGKNLKLPSIFEVWMQNYVSALCINSWQVKRYLDLYSATSIMGLPPKDLHYVSTLYTEAHNLFSNITRASRSSKTGSPNGRQDDSTFIFRKQIDAYSTFLDSIAKLARSAWTEFNLLLMGVGLSIMLASLLLHHFTILRVNMLCQSNYLTEGMSSISFRLTYAYLLAGIRGASFLSNSYILEEGHVANFLLATSGILTLRCTLSHGKFAVQDVLFLVLNIILRLGIEFGTSKRTGSASLNIVSLSILGIHKDHPLFMALLEILPILVLPLLLFLLYKCTCGISCWRYFKFSIFVVIACSYMLIALHLISENTFLANSEVIQHFGRNFAPRVVYAIGFGMLVFLVLSKIFYLKDRAPDSIERLVIATVALLSAWSPTILLLLGWQGPFVALILISGALCILGLQKLPEIGTGGTAGGVLVDPIWIANWSLLAVCLFFYTGHWCTFDGLRYGAAFVGFEHFNIIRQGLLLAIDTFGVSHILPILSLPFFVIHKYQISGKNTEKVICYLNLTQVFLTYGFMTALTSMFTIICVTIQRRHLMMWGLFAPKFVFDVLGLILTDALIFLASLYYY